MNALNETDNLFMIERLGRAAYEQNRHEAATSAYRRGRKLATDQGNERWRIRFCGLEGHTHRMMVEFDKALPALLEVTENNSDEADPRDVTTALNDLVSICLEIRTATYTRKLIEQFESHLIKSRSESCLHFVYYLNGLLAAHRGDHLAAYQQFHRAWEVMGQNRLSPHYSEAVHLVELCNTAFRLRDGTKLTQWVNKIEPAAGLHDLKSDTTRAIHGRLLLMRLARASGDDFSCAARLAGESLRRLDAFDGRALYLSYELCCLRVLMLSGAWQELDEQLAHYPLPRTFGSLLFTVDKEIARSCHELGLRVPDLEIETLKPLLLPPLCKSSPLEDALLGCREVLSELQHLAQLEDLRLETNQYSHQVSIRSQLLGVPTANKQLC